MRYWVYLTAVIIPLAVTPYLSAQRVMYCEPATDRFTVRTELAGKAGDYYWMQSTHRRRPTGRTADLRGMEVQTFDIYDTRMKPVNTVPALPVTDATLKEYLVSSYHSFDHLVLLGGPKKTSLFLQRYTPDGVPIDRGRMLDSFPFNEIGRAHV